MPGQSFRALTALVHVSDALRHARSPPRPSTSAANPCPRVQQPGSQMAAPPPTIWTALQVVPTATPRSSWAVDCCESPSRLRMLLSPRVRMSGCRRGRRVRSPVVGAAPPAPEAEIAAAGVTPARVAPPVFNDIWDTRLPGGCGRTPPCGAWRPAGGTPGRPTSGAPTAAGRGPDTRSRACHPVLAQGVATMHRGRVAQRFTTIASAHIPLADDPDPSDAESPRIGQGVAR